MFKDRLASFPIPVEGTETDLSLAAGDPAVPLSAPDITEAEIQAVNEVLAGPSLSRGSKLTEFEEAFAASVGRRYAVAVTNGTAGLHLSVIEAGVRQGDLVITTPFSFVASANVMLYERATPIFVDVDPVTGNIDPGLVREAVEVLSDSGSRDEVRRWLPPLMRDSGREIGTLRGIIPVHIFGQPADLDPILQVASKYSLKVIEDACEAVGAAYRGRPVGSLGDAAVFAFYPNKQMTTGEGGVIVTDSEESWKCLRSLRNQGRDCGDDWLCHERLGYNYRLDEMSAALGLVQLKRLGELLEKRAQVAHWYIERLQDIDSVEVPPVVDTTTRMSWFIFVVRVRPPLSRRAVQDYLAEQGIPSRPYFLPIHLQPYYRQSFGYAEGAFPVAEELGRVSLALPFSGIMTESQVDFVCAHLAKACRR